MNGLSPESHFMENPVVIQAFFTLQAGLDAKEFPVPAAEAENGVWPWELSELSQAMNKHTQSSPPDASMMGMWLVSSCFLRKFPSSLLS